MRAISPIVSTDWLEENIDDPKLVIIDIRLSGEFAAGHIPNAVNIPFPEAMEIPNSDWFVERGGLLLELPEEADLFNTIGNAGISSDSLVVVVTKPELPHPLVDAAIVADRLIYAGVKNVAILDGAYDKWANEGRPVSFATVEPAPVKYTAKVDTTMYVYKEYVQKKINEATIVSTLGPDSYFGVGGEMLYAGRAGHIPTAKCLPVYWIWTEEKTYRPINELKGIASGVVGDNTSKEIILYCGVGGNSSGWWFVLTQMLGYNNVKIYNGAIQEWARDPEAPLVVYKWE